ncbi:hypothetical protein PIB30_062171 [Stylosanthes scabra]|uniref:Uncharacterized protein n=1 Tax=Stylosanthes scabra TaxID=79078 RepID=A0ABU6ZJU2_9FABA|nr:hypothetical protein [Stylosanthes scabra]
MILGNTAGVLPRWLGCTGTFAEHPTGTWSRSQGHYSSYRAGYSGSFLASNRMGSISPDGRWLLGGKSICLHRMRRIRGYSNTRPSLIGLHTAMYDIYSRGSPGSGPIADYLRWWYLAARRFLAPDDAFYSRPLDEIPPEAIQRVADTLTRGTQVDDVPDNRHPDRRLMVGMRTTDRDWQWLDEMMGEEAAAPRRVRRMLEDGGRRGGRRGGRGEAGSLHLSPMVVRAALIRQGLASRASTGFQRTLQQILVDDTTYRPGFDGSQGQVQMDLNEPASAPSHLFTTYAETPTSAYMPDAHFMDPYMVPAPTPEDPLQTIAVETREVHPWGDPPTDDSCGTGGTCSVYCMGYGLCYYVMFVWD